MSLRIRPPVIEDAPALLSMIHALAAHHGDPPEASAATLARDVFCTPPWLTVLVAATDRPVGYAALTPLAQLQRGMRGMDLHHLFVAPTARGHGIGAALLGAAKTRARAAGCDFLSVGTHPENRDAQSFYLARGFERLDSHPPRFRHLLG